MYLRVKSSPEKLPDDFALNEEAIEAVRFMDERGHSLINLLRETSCELAQYQERCEELEKRLSKYEKIDEFEPVSYVHSHVEI